MNMLLIKTNCIVFIVSEISRVSVIGYFPLYIYIYIYIYLYIYYKYIIVLKL